MSSFLIYKSSAGSGKTTALIQIFLKLSLRSDNPNQFKKLLAITFTNKAAAEMKERFIGELDRISNTSLDYSEGNFMVDWLLTELKIDIKTLRNRAQATFERALQDYDDIAISTIDRFNHRLIRSFSRELGIHSDFEVSMNTDELYHEAVMRVIEQYGDNEMISNALLKYIKLKSDNEEKINVVTALEKLKSLVISDDAENAIRALEEFDFDETEKKYRANLLQITKKIQQFGKDFLSYCEENGLEDKDFYQGKRGVYGYFVKCRDFPITSVDPNSYVNATREGKWSSKAGQATVAPFESHLSELLEHALHYIEAQMPIYRLQKELSEKLNLIAVLGEVFESISIICEEQNIVPIHAFNLIISQALRHEPVAYLYEQIGSRYKHILIDEYQDTSQLQWFNLLPLIDESLATGNETLVVGDAKQSIYRFRGGKAEQLISLPKLVDAPPGLKPTEEALERNHHTVHLDHNYRSQKRIIEFNNAFFSSLPVLQPFKNELYNEAYFEENVVQKTKSTTQKGYIKSRAWKKGKGEELIQDTEFIFDEIQACKNKGYAYGDMAILVSRKKHAEPIIQRLRAENIAVSTTESLQLDQAPEIRFVVAILRILHERDNVSAMLVAMRNYGFIQGVPFEVMPYLKKQKLNNTLDFSAFLKKQGLPPIGKVKGAPSIFEAAQQISAMYLPDARTPYLAGFFDTVLNHFGYNGTISDFLKWWDELQTKPSLTTESSPDAIQVMTIHKSKGLQFKVVFMPRASWKIHSSAQNVKYNWFDLKHIPEAILPFAPLPVSNKLNEMGLEKEWLKEEDDIHFDHYNLLYVAFTRAENGLVFSYWQEPSSTSEWLDVTMSQLKTTFFSKDDSYRFTENEEYPVYTELSVGELDPPKKQSETNENQISTLNKPHEPQSLWSERVKPASREKSDDQTLGVILHQLAATARNLDEAQFALDRMKSRFAIDSNTYDDLNQLIHALFSDGQFTALIQKGKVFAERDVLIKGETKRPDMVVETGTETIILDFKTGDESKSHQKQVAEYMAGLSHLTSNKVMGFLLYVGKTVNWVEVKIESGETQTSLFA